MKFTEDNVLRVEHQTITDLCLWDAPEEERQALLMYIAGVHDMAQNIIDAMAEIKKL